MPFVRILLAYQKEFDKGKGSTGNVQVRGNAFAVCEEKVADHFGIPVYTAAAATQKEIQTYTYTKFDGLADATGKSITVPGHSRTANASNPRKRPHSVRLTTRIAKSASDTTKGYRTASIRFPWFFSIPMIGQALGTMIKKNEPIIWTSERGKSYPLIKMDADVSAGAKVGAWNVAEPIPEVNTKDTPSVADGASASTTGGKKG